MESDEERLSCPANFQGDGRAPEPEPEVTHQHGGGEDDGLEVMEVMGWDNGMG
jgi:hypothetical protein